MNARVKYQESTIHVIIQLLASLFKKMSCKKGVFMSERTFIRVPKFFRRDVVMRTDEDGVITRHEGVIKKFVGKPVEEMLYIKTFQYDDRSFLSGLTAIQHEVFSFLCSQVRDRSNQFILIQSEVFAAIDGGLSNSSYHIAIKALVARKLIHKVSDCRYALNPYYAAVGSNNEVKELRKWWDETHKTQPSQTKE
jgi:hypothetical protein